MYSVECSYQRAIIDECNQLNIDIEGWVEASQSQMNNSMFMHMDDKTVLDRGTLGQSLLLVSSDGNAIQGLNDTNGS